MRGECECLPVQTLGWHHLCENLSFAWSPQCLIWDAPANGTLRGGRLVPASKTTTSYMGLYAAVVTFNAASAGTWHPRCRQRPDRCFVSGGNVVWAQFSLANMLSGIDWQVSKVARAPTKV